MSKQLEYLALEAARGRLSRREFMGRAAALGLTIPAASKLLTSTALAQGPQTGGDLLVGMVGGESTNTLDPAQQLTQVPQVFTKTWGETLVIASPEDSSAVGLLAESWDASDDAKVWSFKIREGVTFHDGKTLTPDDVVATLRRHSDPNSESGALGVLGDIADIQADGGNVVVTLNNANADLPLLFADYHLVIQPNGGMDDPLAGIGTGPYRVEADEPGVRHLSVRYEDHWRKGEVGFVDSVEVLVMNDTTARLAALQSGQVHMINRVEPATVAQVQQMPNLVLQRAPSRGHYVFIMHCNTPPFDNADLRNALKLAIDREAIITNVLQGYATIGNDFPINAAYPYFPADIEQRTYDPDQARSLYQKSGHSGPILLQVSEVAFPGAVDAAVLFQQQAAAAGIQLEVKREPGDGYWDQVWNVQPFCASYWGGRPTQDGMYSTAYYSKADWNDTRFFREDFDQLLLQARGELDEARRAQLYHDMALMVRNDGGLILPMFNDFIDAHTDQVMGWVPDANSEMSNLQAPIRVWLAS
jgi:peptide/nickel transport system substrate-binding protein